MHGSPNKKKKDTVDDENQTTPVKSTPIILEESTSPVDVSPSPILDETFTPRRSACCGIGRRTRNSKLSSGSFADRYMTEDSSTPATSSSATASGGQGPELIEMNARHGNNSTINSSMSRSSPANHPSDDPFITGPGIASASALFMTGAANFVQGFLEGLEYRPPPTEEDERARQNPANEFVETVARSMTRGLNKVKEMEGLPEDGQLIITQLGQACEGVANGRWRNWMSRVSEFLSEQLGPDWSSASSLLDEETLQKYLSKNTITDRKVWEEIKKDNWSCCICTDSKITDDEEFQLIMLCNGAPGHYFHKQCILEWLRRQNNCPLCRRHPAIVVEEMYGESDESSTKDHHPKATQSSSKSIPKDPLRVQSTIFTTESKDRARATGSNCPPQPETTSNTTSEQDTFDVFNDGILGFIASFDAPTESIHRSQLPEERRSLRSNSELGERRDGPEDRPSIPSNSNFGDVDTSDRSRSQDTTDDSLK